MTAEKGEEISARGMVNKESRREAGSDKRQGGDELGSGAARSWVVVMAMRSLRRQKGREHGNGVSAGRTIMYGRCIRRRMSSGRTITGCGPDTDGADEWT
ncbi:hypothetical protein, partial [Salmonella enterica]|uniref:hypothetical protein n=1 Tax=Salmonella enterica TaxID=28901 RepID=UPI00398C5A94